MRKVLNECPFCGGEAELTEAYAVRCKKCNTMGGVYDNPSGAIDAWNNRYILKVSIDEVLKDTKKKSTEGIIFIICSVLFFLMETAFLLQAITAERLWERVAFGISFCAVLLMAIAGLYIHILAVIEKDD